MEGDTMLVDDGFDINVKSGKKRPSSESNRCKSKFVPLGIGLVVAAFIGAAITIAVLKSTPEQSSSTGKFAGNKNIHVAAWEGIFTTNYITSDENESLKIANIDRLIDQLNTKLKNKGVQIIGAFFSSREQSDKATCVNSLPGLILQLNFVVFDSRYCAGQTKEKCKVQFQKELTTTQLNIEFDQGPSKTINIKFCHLIDMTEENPKIIQKTAVLPARGRRMKVQASEDSSDDNGFSNIVLKSSRCSMQIGKLMLVQMAGEYSTRFQDDVRIHRTSTDEHYRQFRTVEVYDNMYYQLQVQLTCQGLVGLDSTRNICEMAQDVYAWIDFNDNNYADSGETHRLYRTQSKRKSAVNMYDLEVYIPVVDEVKTKSGAHKMTLTIKPSDEYKRSCNGDGYVEMREYTVIIRSRQPQPIMVYTTAAPPPRIIINPACSMIIPKISLVLMAGQKGTEIRDDKPTGWGLTDHRSQHHLAVTLFENTVYLIRIQLDCNTQLDKDKFAKGCNLAQDVNVWIDLNNDGRFDDSEIGAPYRWPVTSYLPEGIYDLQIRVPLINEQSMRSGRHTMRLVVSPTAYYLRTCGISAYNETRDYTVNIIKKSDYIPKQELGSVSPTVINSMVCTPQVNKVLFVVMAGEQRTQIRDEPSLGLIFEDNNQDQPIVLYQDSIYLLRILLDCGRQWNDKSYEHNCHLIYNVDAWIDLNDDGIFDPSENAAPYHWPLNSYTPKGNYDLQIYTPVIDTRVTKHGPHRMQLIVTTTDYYQKKCNYNNYKEIRNYTAYIIPYRSQAVDIGVSYVPLSDNVCSQPNGKIALVIMAGEQGTQIRDNIATGIALPESQNRHHLAVSLYENTVYRLRIQLGCRQQSDGSWSEVNCNLAKDVNVLIDFNNDGKYDESESRTPRRWPLHSSILLGIYDFEIEIPAIDRQFTTSGTHLMRIVVGPSSEYNSKCGRSDHQETREYSIVILPRVTYPSFVTAYCSAGNLVCSNDNTINLIDLVGEQNTKLYDQTTQCRSTNNYLERTSQTVTLFDNTAYTLRIGVNCQEATGSSIGGDGDDGFDYSSDSVGQAHLSSSRASTCSANSFFNIWIDFNDDGTFDQNTEQIHYDNNYSMSEQTSEHQIKLVIPDLGGGYYRNKPHRMRIVMTTNKRNIQACYNSGFGEARDYTVQIISRSGF